MLSLGVLVLYYTETYCLEATGAGAVGFTLVGKEKTSLGVHSPLTASAPMIHNSLVGPP